MVAALLAGCGGDGGDGGTGDTSAERAAPGTAGLADESGAIGTPNEDRIATLGLLNKRNNLTQDLVMKTGESRRIGNVVVKLESCERTVPWERNEETGAFVQVQVEERFGGNSDPELHTVFSGWLFKNSPSLNVVEHPVYDVWVKDCSMNFPGEEAKPASSASRARAANASGSGSGATASE